MSEHLMRSLAVLRQELAYLKQRLSACEEKLSRLIQSVPSGNTPGPSGKITEPQQIPLTQPLSRPALQDRPETDVEFNLGRFWLNKIGIVIFALGVSFLLAYTFKYFGPFMKILTGYCMSVVFFACGWRLEKKAQFTHYGRVLLGGAWAIGYFTTYAMYHFEASRILHNELIDLCLLGLVALGMLAHSLKYRSEDLSVMALSVAYITATAGTINYYTLLSVFLLGCVALILVERMQWMKMLSAGIAFAYAAHIIWVFKHIRASFVPPGGFDPRHAYFLLNTGFLILYWLLFGVGIHLIRRVERDVERRRLAAAQFMNFMLFFFLVYPKFIFFYPQDKFAFLSLLGVAYLCFMLVSERAKNGYLFAANAVAALSILTHAVSVWCVPYHAVIFWNLEVPGLLLLGVLLRKRVFRLFALILALLVWVRVMVAYDYGWLVINNWMITWERLFWWTGAISCAACYGIYRWAGSREDFSHQELSGAHFFSLIAVYYATELLAGGLSSYVLSVGLALEAMVLCLLGLRLKDIYLVRFGAIILCAAAVRFWFVDAYPVFSQNLRWLYSTEFIALSLGVYALYKQARLRVLGISSPGGMPLVIFALGMISVVVAILKFIPENWMSLVLGMSGVSLFSVGFLSQDKVFRVGGFVVFGLTLARVFFIDLGELPFVYKIVSFLILGLLFLGVSFVYTKLQRKGS